MDAPFPYHATTPIAERLDSISPRRYGQYRFITDGVYVYWAFANEAGRDLFVLDYADQGATSKRSEG
jgi:hypothetical protein